MDIHASNIANADTTRTPEGGPYQRKTLGQCEGWKCEVLSMDEYRLARLPDHPDADETGFVGFPVVNVVEEIQGIIDAQEKFEVLVQIRGSWLTGCL